MVRIAIAAVLAAWLAIGQLSVSLARGYDDKFKFGIHLDPQIGWFSVDNNRFENSGVSLGFCPGVDREYIFERRYSLGTGISYELRGGSLQHLVGGYHLKTRYDGNLPIKEHSVVYTRTSLLTIPITLKMRAIEIGYTTFWAAAGFTGHITLSETAESPSNGIKTTKLNGMYQPFYVGYIMQLGVEYSLGGPSSLVGGIGFNGTFGKAYNPGLGLVSAYNLHLRIGFTF